ncbi:MAG: LysM peptidoglycan-binding domain-containing protein [Planctomycetes bacterium]|nr:LysM peptidoglycan-binding domain-containing protein [Planctomycetota bacterium]
MSDSKASSRKKKIIRSRYQREREDQKDDPDEKGSDSDWGFSEGEKGMAKETKIVLSLISILLVMFGYLVYQRLTKSEDFFSGDDDEGQMKVAKVPKNPSKNKGENEFGLGEGTGGENSTVFGFGDPGERTELVQHEPVPDEGDGFFLGDGNPSRENSTINGRQPGEFNQADSGSPFADRNTNPQFDSSTGNEDFRNLDASSGTQNQFPDFNREDSPSQYNQPQEFDGSGSGIGVEQVSQHEADRSPDGERAGDDFSNALDAAGDGRDAERNQFTQQAEPQQVRYSENQQFLNEIPSRQELNSEQESYGFGEQPAGETAVEPGQDGSNQFSQSPQYPDENNPQTSQPDPNAGDYFRADVAAENRYQPEIDASIDRDDRFGHFQEPGFAGGAASVKTTTVRREEPGQFRSRFDSSSPFSGSSTGTQSGEYEIQSGDNYWSISKKQYGTARYFMALSRYNRQRIPDEKRMRPGMKVLTPSPEILQAQFPDLFPKRSAQSRPSPQNTFTAAKTSQPSGFFRGRSREPLYRIGEEDTLSEIAQKHLGRSSRWIQIYEMNRTRLPSPNNLTIGTVLQLPTDASNVRLVSHPQGVR